MEFLAIGGFGAALLSFIFIVLAFLTPVFIIICMSRLGELCDTGQKLLTELKKANRYHAALNPQLHKGEFDDTGLFRSNGEEWVRVEDRKQKRRHGDAQVEP